MAVAKLTSRQPRKQVSVKDRVSEEEWKVRTDLAAAYHLAAIFGWTDIILTHFSARVPGGDEHFLLNAYGLMFDEVTASNLVKVDHEGKELSELPPVETGVRPMARIASDGAAEPVRDLLSDVEPVAAEPARRKLK